MRWYTPRAWAPLKQSVRYDLDPWHMATALLDLRSRGCGELLRLFSLAVVLSGGVLLYCAGIAKLWSVGPAYLFGTVVLSRELHVAIGLAEIALGALVFAFRGLPVVRILMLVTFLGFLGVLGMRYLNGSKYCNCIPGVKSPLSLMFVIDCGILVGIALSFLPNPDWDRYHVRALRGLYIALGLTALILGSQFSSADQAFQALSGQAITVDQSHKVARAEGDLISLPFVLSNHGDNERSILGAKSSCGSTALEGLPATIPGKGKFVAKMTIENAGGVSSQGAREFVSYLYRDDGTIMKIQATVVFANRN
jgi:hypothetical protein